MSDNKAMSEAAEVIAKQREEIDRLTAAQRARPGISVPGVEAKKFSFVKLLKALKGGAAWNDGAWARHEAEYEREVVTAAKAMSRGTDSAGGFLIPEEAMATEDLLRAKLVIAQAGVRMLTGLSGSPVAIPRLSASATAAWEAENAAHTPTDQTIAEVSLTPKRATAATKLGNQLLALNAGAAEQIIRNDLLAIVERLVEKGVIEGTGTSGQPTGIATNGSIGSVAVDDTGTPTAAEQLTALTNAVKTVDVANGDLSRAAWIMHPTDFWSFQGAQVLPYSAAPTPAGLIGGAVSGAAPRTLLGFPVYTTTNMTASGDTTGQILFGDFSQAVLGMWGGMELAVTSEGSTLALADQTLVVVRKYVDVGVINPGAFVKVTDFNA